jgi:hypothetical protein
MVFQPEPPTNARSPRPSALKSPAIALTPNWEAEEGMIVSPVFVTVVPPNAFTPSRNGGASHAWATPSFPSQSYQPLLMPQIAPLVV